ncbi:MAG: lipase [Spirochaetia bacterium]|nr:lipase [Spirochaetia bacterium]
MLRYVKLLSVVALFCGTNAFAGTLSKSYPIVLAHGLFGWGSGTGIVQYWGGEDAYLRSQGVAVLTPTVTAVNGTSNRAAQLKTATTNWMAAHGYTKVNVMGHSQGGLDARYMVANLAMYGKVRTVTTINTPHLGSPVADITLAVIPGWAKPYVSAIVSAVVKVVYGQTSTNVYNALRSLTVSGQKSFNTATPNHSGVNYYSYGSHMVYDLIQHPVMSLTVGIMVVGDPVYGQTTVNDGIVSTDSMKWGTWMGGPSYGLLTTGVDHLEAVNNLYYGQNYYDANGYFLKMATNAMNHQ